MSDSSATAATGAAENGNGTHDIPSLEATYQNANMV